METITLPVSIGEALDKLTILEIKKQLINDKAKLIEIDKEINAIYPFLEKYKLKCQFYYKCLLECNQKIWNLCILAHNFDCDIKIYNQSSIDIVKENDRRCRIKNKINNLFRSHWNEQKSYCKVKAIIPINLDTNNAIVLNSAIRYYSMYYDEIIIFAKDKSVNYIFADDSSTIIKM